MFSKGAGWQRPAPFVCKQVRLLPKEVGIMSETHLIDIQHIAKLARLQLTDEEAARYQAQLGSILSYIDTLSRYDVEGVEPTAHATPVYDILRADKSQPWFDQETSLKNAPKRNSGQFQIPKVIE
jgi:aspartyl-tRNA(Asn)/glutamyl-tRNA(Gln) amidotransferase subunit C